MKFDQVVYSAAAALFVAALSIPAQAQIPAIGTYTGASRSADATCKPLAPVVTVQSAVDASTMTSQLFLPIVTANSANACPVLLNGASFLLDAEDSATRQELLISSAENLALTNIDTTLAVSAVYSPTLTGAQWLDAINSDPNGPNMRAMGIWNFPEMNDGEPVNWESYRDTERGRILEERGVKLFTVTGNTRLARVPDATRAFPIGLNCSAAMGKTWEVSWLAVIPDPRGVLVYVTHAPDQLPSVCPVMSNYNYMPFGEYWRLLPAQERAEIDKLIDDNAQWSRNVWTLPSPSSMQPTLQPATIAVSVLGGMTVAWYAYSAGGGSAMVVFSSINGEMPRIQD